MGVVNANLDSFSDRDKSRSWDALTSHVDSLVNEGADIIDVGGESAITGRPQVDEADEIKKVLPVVEYICARYEVPVSVDTYKPRVVDAVLNAGAQIVNDVSGLKHPEVASLCADACANLVLMHTSAEPKVRLQREDLYPEGVGKAVKEALVRKIEQAESKGLARDSLILDPGPDFTKTPWQTVEALRSISELIATGVPVMAAVSRKDFIGAVLSQSPKKRLAGTLAAVAYCYDRGCTVFRVHDVKEVVNFLHVYRLLRSETDIEPSLRIDELLRHEPASS